jgi:hypothetical protein
MALPRHPDPRQIDGTPVVEDSMKRLVLAFKPFRHPDIIHVRLIAHTEAGVAEVGEATVSRALWTWFCGIHAATPPGMLEIIEEEFIGEYRVGVV